MLTLYNKKRNFKNTNEPKGISIAKNRQFRFVVQRHHASHIHYDFRLEMGGTLKSWAVPKGPSLNPTVKRLAMMVEDHPVSYIDFEGTIPKGNYGAGTVEVWDKGNYIAVNEKGDSITEAQALDALKKGNLKFELKGKKIKGGFALVRLKKDDNKSWLLIKHRDKYAIDKDYNSEDYSKNKKKEDKATTNKPSVEKKTTLIKKPPSLWKSLVSLGNRKVSNYIKPMLCTPSEKAFDDKDWIFELKLDGYRAIAELNKDNLKLYSRNGLLFHEKYPPVIEALRKIKHSAILDGEIVVVNENGKPDFQKLQHYEENMEYHLIYYVFDILSYEGNDLKNYPLIERKQLLKKLLSRNTIVKYCDHIQTKGINFFRQVVSKDLEGIIAKKKDSKYYIGVRSKEWLKIKHVQTDEAVIAGYTQPRGSRKYFGALVLGKYKNGVLEYIGHSGTGFNEESLKDLWNVMQSLIVPTTPFNKKIKVNAPVTWIKPVLVAEMKFTEKTNENIMRHPVFVTLRPDKNATEVSSNGMIKKYKK